MASRSAKLKLPGIGTVAGFGGHQDDKETFYIFTSYNTPTDIYRYDVPANKSELIRRPNVQFNPDDFVVEQVFYKSKDGTRIPMMLAYKKPTERAGVDRERPRARTPANAALRLRRLQHHDLALLLGRLHRLDGARRRRGGGQPPRRRRVRRRLAPRPARISRSRTSSTTSSPPPNGSIAEDRTTSDQLAIMGGSNGGLLVGAVMVQRPELFGACIPIVGVLDMLRFHQFTAGQFWRDEFGDVDNPEEFKNLLAYSPYHNIKDGMQYPATLIMTADTDDRVVPMHSFKFAAALQRAQAGDAPILLRIETRAGHGRGTPVSKLIENAADNWAFLVKNLKMDVPVAKKPAQEAE